MRRFYVVPKTILHEPVIEGPREANGEPIPHHHLFMCCGGFHYIDLGDSGMILLSCDDFKDDTFEALWHAHPNVARLHHPVNHATTKLGALLTDKAHAHKKVKAHHLDALKHIGVTQDMTVWGVHKIASALHPQVKLDEEY